VTTRAIPPGGFGRVPPNKILSKAGASLADIYDVQGSIAGIEQLETRDLPIVHEMGTTIFSERLSGRVLRLFFDDLLQTVTLGASFSGVPEAISRLAGFQILVDDVARLTRVTASLSELDASGTAVQEVPFFAWNTGTGGSTTVRIIDDGNSAADFEMLTPEPGGWPQIPQILTGALQRGVVNGITIRGLTATFGAGTVDIIGLAYLLDADPAGSGISSLGLPIPSW